MLGREREDGYGAGIQSFFLVSAVFPAGPSPGQGNGTPCTTWVVTEVPRWTGHEGLPFVPAVVGRGVTGVDIRTPILGR